MKISKRLITAAFCLLLFLGIFFLTRVPQSFSTLIASNSPIEPLFVHFVNRLSFGPKPGDLEHIQSIGLKAYLEEQFSDEKLPPPPSLTKKLSRLSSLSEGTISLLDYVPELQKGGKLAGEADNKSKQKSEQVLREATAARLLRATESYQQLNEVMVDFWFNHFNVSFDGRKRILVGPYENEAIRPHIFGHFRDMLGATAKHPAMLFYLDNVKNQVSISQNSDIEINENYARELLELHTLGVDGGYSQADVIALAKILTGWRVISQQDDDSEIQENGFYFDSNHHDFSEKIFLGHSIKGSGQSEGEQVLDLLARHPSTARHLSYKLAQYFVSDSPPQSLIEHLSQVYLDTEGNIRSVLEALFLSPEFQDPRYFHNKFKTPYQYVISIIRAANLEIIKPLEVERLLKQMSMGIYGCLSPDGYPNTSQFWINSSSLLTRLTLASVIGEQKVNFLQSSLAGILPRGKLVRMMGWQKINFLKSSFAGSLPLNIEDLSRTIGNIWSEQQQQRINETPRDQWSKQVLGSPEFMYY